MQSAISLTRRPDRGEATPGKADSPSSFEGRVLRGTYRILRPLGRGAMGIVFEAQHLRLYRRVAIKVLPPELVGDPDRLARFQQEAELVSQIQHQNVVNVLDSDVTEEGEPFLVLELLEGETLAERLVRESPLLTSDAVSITMQVALGLAAAHRADVVHRDLKPENVFILDDPDDQLVVKLLDFGIGRSLRAGRKLTGGAGIVGTPDYMSPEQAEGKTDKVGSKTDQFALAILAYQMLTGVQPFEHEDFMETLLRVSTLEVPKASSVGRWLSPELDPVLARGLAKNPDDRFPDVLSFARALVRAAGPGERSGIRPAAAILVTARHDKQPPADASPRTMYVMSRIDDGMTVDEVVDVSGMGRLETLRRLSQLEEWGLVHIG